MSDDEKTASKPATEVLPSRENEISALGSANAPFVFFDGVPFRATINGMGAITLVAERLNAPKRDEAGRTIGITSDHVVTAHLRGTLPAFYALRDAINDIERIANEQAVRAAEKHADRNILQ